MCLGRSLERVSKRLTYLDHIIKLKVLGNNFCLNNLIKLLIFYFDRLCLICQFYLRKSTGPGFSYCSRGRRGSYKRIMVIGKRKVSGRRGLGVLPCSFQEGKCVSLFPSERFESFGKNPVCVGWNVYVCVCACTFLCVYVFLPSSGPRTRIEKFPEVSP